MFRTVPLSIIRSYSLCTQQWYMSYRFVDSCRAGSGWNSSSDDGQRNCPKHVEFHFQNKFEKLVHLVGFIIRKCVTMHGHMNVKFIFCMFCDPLYCILISAFCWSKIWNIILYYISVWKDFSFCNSFQQPTVEQFTKTVRPVKVTCRVSNFSTVFLESCCAFLYV
jgi:hypothetical protein